MNSEVKILLGIGAATLAIVFGAVFFLSKTPNQPAQKVDSKILTRDGSAKISTTSATVTLVEFGDFQCPACGAYYPLVKQLTTEFKENLTFVFRHFPLSRHKNALISAYAVEAAGKQGKFWEMYDLIFAGQKQWSESAGAKDIFVGYANDLKLDAGQFKKDLDDNSLKQKVERDRRDGLALGVNATPTFYLNTEKIQNPASFDDFKTLIKNAILTKPAVQTPAEKYHAHADIKVYLNGKPFDFTNDKYQASETNPLNEDIHLHDGNGEVIHLHKQGASLGDFFSSLNMSLSSSCFLIDNKDNCTSGNSTLKMFVNGQKNTDFANYVPRDLDRILIGYGAENYAALQQQLDSVSDLACIYSLKCPQRGTPPKEQCVGGVGSECVD